jgi:hypothetical protein
MMTALGGGFAATLVVVGAATVSVVDGAVGALQPAIVSIVRARTSGAPRLKSTTCMSEQ